MKIKIIKIKKLKTKLEGLNIQKDTTFKLILHKICQRNAVPHINSGNLLSRAFECLWKTYISKKQLDITD